MPELPEVETIRRGLMDKLASRTISHVRVLDSRLISGSAQTFVSQSVGTRIQSIERHGKYLYLLGHAGVIEVHLRMTGQLLFAPAKAEVADKHVHLIFSFSDGKNDLVYRDVRKFGRWKWLSSYPNRSDTPDAWSSSREDVLARLRDRRGMIKHVLLNQKIIAGLGNIYVDEVLFKTKIHPCTPLQHLTEAKRRDLYTSMRRILSRSIAIGGTSFRDYVDTSGRRGGFKKWLCVYGRSGEKCACGKKILRILVAGRSTHFCPGCQK